MSDENQKPRNSFLKNAALATAMVAGPGLAGTPGFVENVAYAQRERKAAAPRKVEADAKAENFYGVGVIGWEEYRSVKDQPVLLSKAIAAAKLDTVIVDGNLAPEKMNNKVVKDVVRAVQKGGATYGTAVLVQFNVMEPDNQTLKSAKKLEQEALNAMQNGAHGIVFTNLDAAISTHQEAAATDIVAALVPKLKLHDLKGKPVEGGDVRFGLDRGFVDPDKSEKGVTNMIVEKLKATAPDTLKGLYLLESNAAFDLTKPEDGLQDGQWWKQNVDKIVAATELKGDDAPRVIAYQQLPQGKESDKDLIAQINEVQSIYADTAIGVRTNPGKIINLQKPVAPVQAESRDR